jgi:hypothetical protein
MKTKEIRMPHTSNLDKEWSPDIEQQILRAVKNVRYGSVEIIIHDSKIVQIERKEKIRFDDNNPGNRR